MIRERMATSRGRLTDDSGSCAIAELAGKVFPTEFRLITPDNTIQSAGEILGALMTGAPRALLHSRMITEERRSLEEKYLAAKPHSGLMLSTSGSSGVPKIVCFDPRAVIAQAQAVNLHLQSTVADCWLLCLPLFHVGGMAILPRAALSGASVRLTQSSDPAFLSRIIEDEPITLVSLVPTMLRRILEYRAGQPFPERLRAILLGGGPSTQELVERAPQTLRTYGMTEAGSMVTCVALNVDLSERASSGRPIPSAEVKIVNDQFETVKTNSPGRILVRSAGMVHVYLGDREQTALGFREGWIVTEDTGYLDDAGCLHVLGRRDRMLISGGENVSLDEIETAIRRLPDVRDAACVALDDPEWGQIAGALVQVDRDYSRDELLDHLREHLAAHKLPKRILFVGAIPLLPSGKTDHKTAATLF
ncbi:MAG: AMP-binding protein [Calditrichaeota bacterium]|nr:AMP-binding protein [Calditrichota bacterium]